MKMQKRYLPSSFAFTLSLALSVPGLLAAADATEDPKPTATPVAAPEEPAAVTQTPIPTPSDLTDSLQCDHLKRLVRLRLDALEKKQQAWAKTPSKNGATATNATTTKEATSSGSDSADDEEATPRPFTDDDMRTLDRVKVLKSRLDDLCASEGRPASFYTLRAGGETFLNGTGFGTLYPILDLQWWTPLKLSRPKVEELMVANASIGDSSSAGLGQINAPDPNTSLPKWGLVVPRSSLSKKNLSAYTSLGSLFRKELADVWKRWRSDVDKARRALREARNVLKAKQAELKRREQTMQKEEETSKKDVAVLAGVVATLAEPPPKKAAGATAGVASAETLKKLKEMSASPKPASSEADPVKLAKEVADAEKAVQAAKKKSAEVEARSPDEEVLDALELALFRLRPATLAPACKANPLQSLPDRVGPYLIPSTVAIRTQQLWGTVQVGTESLPKLTGYPVTVNQGTIDQSTLADQSSTRFTLRAGFTWQPLMFGNDEDPNTFGASGTLGTILGPLPSGDTSLQNRLFADMGVTMTTNYKVSQLDRDKAVNKAYGKIYLGYRWANYLRYQPADPKTEGRWGDTDRLIGDFRIGWEKLASESAKPFIYCIVDRSVGSRPRIQRDRVGIVVEVALEQAFSGLSSAKGAPSLELAKNAGGGNK